MIGLTRGVLVEYGLSIPPLILVFEFNPKTLSRTRSIQVTAGNAPGTRGGYDFALPTETSRVAQGVTIEPEKFNMEILIDATDRMADPSHPSFAKAAVFGIEPELDTLRSMVEPKSQGPGGMQMLSSLGLGETKAFMRDEFPSVLLLAWGSHILPVFLTSVQVEETQHMPSLKPVRATVTLSFQVIEGNNPFYFAEKVRQTAGAAINTALAGTAAVPVML